MGLSLATLSFGDITGFKSVVSDGVNQRLFLHLLFRKKLVYF